MKFKRLELIYMTVVLVFIILFGPILHIRKNEVSEWIDELLREIQQ